MAENNMNNNKKKMKIHVVVFPAPFQGHITPILHLASSLLHLSPSTITVIHARFNSPDPSSFPNFNFIQIEDKISDSFAANTNSGLALVEAINNNCAETFYKTMLRLCDVRCVVVDSLLYEVQRVANQRLGLPVIAVRTSSVACFNAFCEFPLLLQRGYLPVNEKSKLEMEVPELPPLRVKDLPDIKGFTAEFKELATKIVETTKQSSGIIFNSFEELEGEQISKLRRNLSYKVPVMAVGPLHKFSPAVESSTSLLDQDQTCIDWLNKQLPNSVIYVSFGSVACIDQQQMIEIAWGLCNANKKFLWVLRENSVSGISRIEFPEDLTKLVGLNGNIIRWAPQNRVLQHPSVGGFWTHCGWNSIMESIAEGVPMICSPCACDQMVNSRFVSHVWKVGVELVKIQRGEIEKCVRRLFTDEEMKQRAEQLKQSALFCVRQGGSSYQAFHDLVDDVLFL